MCELWKEFQAGISLPIGAEVPFFTDARLTGDIVNEGSAHEYGYGPFEFLNTAPRRNEPGLIQPALVFRFRARTRGHLFFLPIQTNTERYHGGGVIDEATALLSLLMGIRLRPGEPSRFFEFDSPSLGKPQAEGFTKVPSFLGSSQSSVLPRVALGSHNMNEELALLKGLPDMDPSSAVALVRAARFYQDAVWIAESEPHLSWVMLVLAVEAAAGRWSRRKPYQPRVKVDSVELLQTYHAKLHELLAASCDQETLKKAADQIADVVKSRSKFMKFLMHSMPPPPPSRPPEWARFDWSKDNLEISLNKVYEHRSKALHMGLPFPAPMCAPPEEIRANEPDVTEVRYPSRCRVNAYNRALIRERRNRRAEAVGQPFGQTTYAEVPRDFGFSHHGAQWAAKDTPMLLHLFEYIVRHRLLSWWRSLI